MRNRLLLLSLLLLPVAVTAATDDPPLCEREDTRYEGWYDVNNRLIRYDSCDNCRAVCRYGTGASEGWYDSCDNSLIKRADCRFDNNDNDTYTTFRDVPARHPYADAIERLADDDIISGYSNGTFRPDRNIYRAEFVKLVVLASEENDYFNCTWSESSSRMFRDVPWNAWYQEYLCVAVAKGMISGYKDGTFRPEDPVTLAEASKILTEAFDLPLSSGNHGNNWWSRYIETMDDEGALPDRSMQAGDRLTRGETAFMIDALYNDNNSNRYGDCYDQYGRYDEDYCDDNRDDDCYDRYGRYDADLCDDNDDCYDRYGRYDEDLCDDNDNNSCYDRYGRYDEDLCDDDRDNSCFDRYGRYDQDLCNDDRDCYDRYGRYNRDLCNDDDDDYYSNDGYYDDDDRYDCVIRGCNSQLCVDERNSNVNTSCQWQPEYACYALHNARCERQNNGYCSWTKTNALDQCIEDRN